MFCETEVASGVSDRKRKGEGDGVGIFKAADRKLYHCLIIAAVLIRVANDPREHRRFLFCSGKERKKQKRKAATASASSPPPPAPLCSSLFLPSYQM